MLKDSSRLLLTLSDSSTVRPSNRPSGSDTSAFVLRSRETRSSLQLRNSPAGSDTSAFPNTSNVSS